MRLVLYLQRSFLIKSSYGKRCDRYTNDGRRASETLADGAVLTFGYDNARQLTDEGRSGGSVRGYTIAYTYDNAGNVKTVASTAGTTTLTWDADSPG